jgi:hypothetical protein
VRTADLSVLRVTEIVYGRIANMADTAAEAEFVPSAQRRVLHVLHHVSASSPRRSFVIMGNV